MAGRKRVVLGGVAALALLGAASAGWSWWTEGRFLETTDDAYVLADIAPIGAKVPGYVRELPVDNNRPVKAGDVLAVLDDSDYRARADQAAAGVAAQRAALLSNDARILWQRSVIEQARSGVVAAEAELRRATLELGRSDTLASRAWATQQRLESATADRGKAAASLSHAKAALTAETDQLGVIQAQRHELEAALAQAEAQLALARDDLGHTVIRAPIDGVVGNRMVQLGVLARPGVQLMVVVPLGALYVDANFKETQLRHMRPGQVARVGVDAFPDLDLVGRVGSFAPASGSRFSLLPPENATGNFTKIVQRVPVRILLPPSTGLRPGLSVVVSVDTRGGDDAGAH